MKTKFNVGDAVLIEGIVETIYVETTDNEPIYHVRIKGAGTHEAYGIRVKEDVMKKTNTEMGKLNIGGNTITFPLRGGRE